MIRSKLSPFSVVLQQDVMPVARRLKLSRRQVTTVLRSAHNLPHEKRKGVWKFTCDGGLERFIAAIQQHAKSQGTSIAVVCLDLLNIGAQNAERSETWVNSHVINPLVDLAIESAAALCGRNPGSWFECFHYGGGDEYVIVLYGIDEHRLVEIDGRMLEAREITSAFDTLVRTSTRFAIRSGLDMVPHSKRWWRIGYWGTGILYGISTWNADQADKTPEQMLDEGFVLVQRYKRGQRGQEGNPLDLSIPEQCRRMVRMPLCIMEKLFGINFRQQTICTERI